MLRTSQWAARRSAPPPRRGRCPPAGPRAGPAGPVHCPPGAPAASGTRTGAPPPCPAAVRAGASRSCRRRTSPPSARGREPSVSGRS
jgi:hypothetical protein